MTQHSNNKTSLEQETSAILFGKIFSPSSFFPTDKKVEINLLQPGQKYQLPVKPCSNGVVSMDKQLRSNFELKLEV